MVKKEHIRGATKGAGVALTLATSLASPSLSSALVALGTALWGLDELLELMTVVKEIGHDDSFLGSGDVTGDYDFGIDFTRA